MRRRRILLDIDGVCANFAQAVVDEVNKATGQWYRVEQISTWDIYDALEVSDGVRAIVDERIRAPGFCADLRQYPGAREGVEALREIADVYAVTAPFDGPHWVHERKHWLLEELDFQSAQVIFTDAKHVIAGDLLIDDRPATLRGWLAERGYSAAIAALVDGPWNQLGDVLTDAGTHFPRVRGWADIVPFVRGVAAAQRWDS